MMFLASLFPNPSLDKLKLILYRREKGDGTQTSASPTEQALGVCCSNFGNLFAGCLVNFCNFISNIRDESRFVALASVRDRRQKWRIGLDQNSFQRQLTDNLTFF